MAKNGRKRVVKHFNFDERTKKLLELYDFVNEKNKKYKTTQKKLNE